MLTESCCFLSLEVESFVQAATKNPCVGRHAGCMCNARELQRGTRFPRDKVLWGVEFMP